MVDQKQLDLLADAVASELKARRDAAGLSKNEVATRAGLAVSFVSYLARLAAVYETTASQLLASSEARVVPPP